MTAELEEALRQSRSRADVGPAIRAEGADQLGKIGGPVATARLRELLHDDNYVVYVTAVEALTQQGATGLQLVLEEAARDRPVGGLLWAEVALSEVLMVGLDVRAWLAGQRGRADPVGAVAAELWDALWLDLDAAEPGARGRGVTPEEITEDWTFVDWLRLSRVFLPRHAEQAAAGLATLQDDRAWRRLVQMAHSVTPALVESACEALLGSGPDGVDVVLRLSDDCQELYLLDAICLPIQWAVPGDLRAALTDRHDHAPDPVVREAAAEALHRFRFAMPPLPGEPPRDIQILRLAGDPVPAAPEDVP